MRSLICALLSLLAWATLAVGAGPTGTPPPATAASPKPPAEAVWPEATADDRYEKMGEANPFAVATVTEAPKPPTESFAATWELTGAGTLPDGRDYVSIRSRDRRLAFSLTGDEPSKDKDAEGVSLSAVHWSSGWRKTTATLKKGTEYANVEYSPEAAAPPMAPNLPGAGGNGRQPMGVPGTPGVLPQVYNQQGIKAQPPAVRNINPSPMNGLVIPNSAPILPSSNGLPQGNGAAPQRKVRVINTK